MAHHPVTHFEIQGPDPTALTAFYSGVFGWKLSEMPGGGAMVAPTRPGIGGDIGASPNGTAHLTFYVETSDIRETLSRIEQSGGRKLLEPVQLPGNLGVIAQFEDPAGNVVGLFQPPPGRAVSGATTEKARKRKVARKPARKTARKSVPKRRLKRR
ncbi:MAG: VOC family protein [Myxococcota bacterium]